MNRETKLDALIAIGILGVLVGVLYAQSFDGKITLQWDAPVQGVTFNVYHSPDATAPVSTWQRLTNVVGTNRATVTVIPGEHYFIVTASNFWGESGPSNIASTPAVPPEVGSSLKISRGVPP